MTLDEPTRRFLDRQRVAYLATADASGAPHVVPICFVLLDDAIYVAIDEKPKRADFRGLRRLRNIAENPRVAIVADVYDDLDWSRLGFVLLHARAHVIEPRETALEHARAVRALTRKYPQYERMALDGRPLIVAHIESVTTWGRLAE
jgi:PPOX class probable F420-dependent enzyme